MFWHKYPAKTGRLRSARSLVLINQSKPNERSLDPQQRQLVVGGGDHLLTDLLRCFKQAIQSCIVTLSTSVTQVPLERPYFLIMRYEAKFEKVGLSDLRRARSAMHQCWAAGATALQLLKSRT